MPVSTTPGTQWADSYTNLNGQLYSEPVPFRHADGRIGWVHFTHDGSLWFKEELRSGGIGAWTKIENTSGGKEFPATVTGGDGRVRIYYYTDDGSLYGVNQTVINGSAYSRPFKIGDGCARYPAACLSADGRTNIFYNNANGEVFHVRHTSGVSGNYTTPVKIGGSADLNLRGLGVALDGSGRIVLGAKGKQSSLYVLQQQYANSGVWTTEQERATNVVSGITAVGDAADRVFLFYRSNNNHDVYFVAQDATYIGLHAPRNMGGQAKGNVHAALAQDNRINVVVHGYNEDALWVSVQNTQLSIAFDGFVSLGGVIGTTYPSPRVGRGASNLLHVSLVGGDNRSQFNKAQGWT
ncbi:hypothetical protein [Streptomyces sp. NPDC018000]|uniref:hypothetical protein n=1 Tax=Streptomyces sp. NPDC018000 TaxID=3365028 RepID=UPI0037885B5F